MSDCPFAIHVTWTTYGTWLPGDARGYVSPTRQHEADTVPKQNLYGTPYAKNDSYTRQIAYAEQKFPTVYLNEKQALVVAQQLVDATESRHWLISQAAIMKNHTHVMMMQCPEDGSAVRRILKGTTQAALSKQAGTPNRWWTQGGSNRYKYDQLAIDNANRYIKNQDGILVGIENGLIYIP
jgi:REP element-mobilizing transposase RayT